MLRPFVDDTLLFEGSRFGYTYTYVTMLSELYVMYL